MYIQRSAALFALLLGLFAKANAQNKTEPFELKMPGQKISGSRFNNIVLLDARRDTTNFGIVQVGMFNSKARVVAKINFQDQLNNLLSALNDSTAAAGKLLLQLRQLSFAEVTGAMSEKGYCFVRANLFEVKDSSYRLVNSIDTVITFNAMDATKKLLRKGSETITDFIAASLAIPGTDSISYNYAAVLGIDSVEKRNILLYNIDHFEDGVYKTFASFKKQLPDSKNIIVKMKDSSVKNVKLQYEDGTSEKIKSKDIYALVYKGLPYIATNYGYYQLSKKGDDFFFTGQAQVTANAADVVAASFFFGIIGGLLASNDSAVFEMKIDHLNGGFIHLREIASAAPGSN